MSQKLKIPEEEIVKALAAVSERDQIRLWHTKWKDGIDIEVPSTDARRFAEAIATPYIERIAQAEAESHQLYGALVAMLDKHCGVDKTCPAPLHMKARAAIRVYESRGKGEK